MTSAAPTPLGPEPGNPPEGHTEWTDPDCKCVIQYGPSGHVTATWSCMRIHFPATNPHPRARVTR